MRWASREKECISVHCHVVATRSNGNKSNGIHTILTMHRTREKRKQNKNRDVIEFCVIFNFNQSTAIQTERECNSMEWQEIRRNFIFFILVRLLLIISLFACLIFTALPEFNEIEWFLCCERGCERTDSDMIKERTIFAQCNFNTNQRQSSASFHFGFVFPFRDGPISCNIYCWLGSWSHLPSFPLFLAFWTVRLDLNWIWVEKNRS